eukprot:TRINITY_DN108287_c0_g1_i1.p1 TRINITY_DN108287_c0_g1~~TRINITY_DN108287_c0_g1_i1.p1  ORF type:complete len:386 (-),score=73.88 TRINITY_DN108287_c0_g1_i1:48-1205(-)
MASGAPAVRDSIRDSSAFPGGSAASVAASAAASAAASGSQLEIEFAATMRRVEAALHGAPRHIRIRGEQWAQRLGLLACVRQPLFRKDRNLHAELLLRCIQEGSWTEPMDRHPPEGPLPCLPRHVACALRRQRAERIGLSRGQTPTEHVARQEETSQPALAAGRQGYQDAPGVSLADAAAAAVGVRTEIGKRPDALVPSVSRPSVSLAVPSTAYSALAARVAQLEEQNRQLRKQLGQAQRLCPSPQQLQSPSIGSYSAQSSVAPLPIMGPVEVAAQASRGRSTSPSRQQSYFQTLQPEQLQQLSLHRHEQSEPVKEMTAAVTSLETALSAKRSTGLSAQQLPPGPPPPEGDTEGFLRYLDAFQAYAGSLFVMAEQPENLQGMQQA